jgi:hypothetical protein
MSLDRGWADPSEREKADRSMIENWGRIKEFLGPLCMPPTKVPSKEMFQAPLTGPGLTP